MSAATVWSAVADLTVGTIVAPTSGDNGLFFKVTQAGTTGGTEPNWVTVLGEIVYDNTVRYISISSVASDLENFLDARVNAANIANDSDSFDFTPPGETVSQKFVCQSWTKSIPFNNRATIQATFREVFEP